MTISSFLQKCPFSKNVVIAKKKKKKKKTSFYAKYRTFFCHKTLATISQAYGALSIFTEGIAQDVYQVFNKITYIEICSTRKRMQNLGYESGKTQAHQACVFLCFPV